MLQSLNQSSSDNLCNGRFSSPTYPVKRIFVLLAAIIPALFLFVYFTITTAGAAEEVGQAVLYFDMVLDEANGRLIGTDYNGNKIDIIDTTTLTVVMTIPATGPAGIDINPADDEFAVAVNGEGHVKFFSLTTLSVTGVVTPDVPVDDPNLPYDVIYGRPGRLYSTGSPGGGGLDYVHTIDTAGKVEVGRSTVVVRSGPRLGMTADQNTLYVGLRNQSPSRIYRFDITSDIPLQTANTPSSVQFVFRNMAVTPSGDKIYNSWSNIWNGDLTTPLGNFFPPGTDIEFAPGLNRFYINDAFTSQVVEFDGDVHLPLAYFPIPGEPGVMRVNDAETILYVNSDAGVEAVALDDPGERVAAVSLTGPNTGLLNTTYNFTATALPPTTTTPIIYSWQASEQDIIHQSNLLSDTVSLIWLTTGPKTITVTARNRTGDVVTATHVITMTGPPIPDPVSYFDMVVDDSRQLIYGSDEDGDLVHVLDMNSLDVLTSIPVGVGAEPAGMDISPNGDELAVALPGLKQIAFVDLNSLVVEIMEAVSTPASDPPEPNDLLYGRPGRLYWVGRHNDDVRVIDTIHDVQVGSSSEINGSNSRLAITADKNTLFVSEVSQSPQKIYRYDITSDNPIQTAEGPHGPMMVDTMAVTPDGSKVFSSQGQIWNNGLDTLLGAFMPFGNEIEYITSLNRFYISSGSQVVEFDSDIYLPLGFHSLSNSAGVARANMAATILYVSTENGVEAIPLDAPAIPPTAVSLSGPSSGLMATFHTFTAEVMPGSATNPFIYTWQAQEQEITYQSNNQSDTIDFEWLTPGPKTITVTARNTTGVVVTATHIITMTGPPIPGPADYYDMVVDDVRGLIYGSDENGDLVHVIDQDTGQIISSVPLGFGAMPKGMDISPDGSELAVALQGAEEIAFVSLDTLLVAERVVLTGENDELDKPLDLVYGRPGRLYAIALYIGSEKIYTIDTDNKVEVGRSTQSASRVERLEITADHNTLYVAATANVSPLNIRRWDVTTDIPVQTGSTPNGPANLETMAINPADNRVYTSRGQVWNSDLDTQVGSFSPFGMEITFSAVRQMFYVSTGSQVSEFDADDYSFIRSYPVAGTAGVIRLNGPESVLYVSTAGGVVEIVLGAPPVPVMEVDIEGPVWGNLDVSYSFTANVVPISATTPLTYVWTVEGQGTFTFTNQGTSHSVTFDWPLSGSKAISVTVSNQFGSAVANHTIVISNPAVYLPVVLK